MKKKLVVIIDDEIQILDVLRIMVDKFGYKTECFYSVNQSLEYIKNNKVDLILLDYSIPEEDGLENIKNILKAKPETKILLLSGLDMSQCDSFKKLGVFDCLQKPIKMEILEDCIKINLDK